MTTKEKDASVQKMILVPFEKYQRLLSSPVENVKTEIPISTSELKENSSQTEPFSEDPEETTVDRKTIPKRKLPPPPGIPVKRIKWLKL